MILEKTSRSISLNRQRDERLERAERQLRKCMERNGKMFDQGFMACIKLVEAGASLERLYQSSGVAVAECEDTMPHALVSFEDEPTKPDAILMAPYV